MDLLAFFLFQNNVPPDQKTSHDDVCKRENVSHEPPTLTHLIPLIHHSAALLQRCLLFLCLTLRSHISPSCFSQYLQSLFDEELSAGIILYHLERSGHEEPQGWFQDYGAELELESLHEYVRPTRYEWLVRICLIEVLGNCVGVGDHCASVRVLNDWHGVSFSCWRRTYTFHGCGDIRELYPDNFICEAFMTQTKSVADSYKQSDYKVMQHIHSTSSLLGLAPIPSWDLYSVCHIG